MKHDEFVFIGEAKNGRPGETGVQFFRGNESYFVKKDGEEVGYAKIYDKDRKLTYRGGYS